MRRLISFILLMAVFWGGWELFLYQAQPEKEAVVTIGVTLPLTGANAETGLAAQDAINLALKDWNGRKNRYKYRIFYLDDSGTTIEGCSFIGGCKGNLKAISKLVTGRPVAEVTDILRGNTCGMKPTSCADQLCRALDAAQAKARA